MVSVDLGASAPTIRRLAALPPSGEAVWPTLLFDMRYEGSFSILLETKVRAGGWWCRGRESVMSQHAACGQARWKTLAASMRLPSPDRQSLHA